MEVFKRHSFYDVSKPTKLTREHYSTTSLTIGASYGEMAYH